ncbi:GTP cyclohydrolase I FolE [Streptomyces sp. NPDC007901]|uniref:GTP cyclohydrolase I FolE n=1 Tax=Streptomyces sp. NPDC007901 TaxID=3364785 RepID=UPI0036F0E641
MTSLANDPALGIGPAVSGPVSLVGNEELRIDELVRELLGLIGENPDREGLRKTPERVRKAIRFLTEGYETKISDVIGDAIFDEDVHNLVVVRDIEFYSQCEHHMLPFFGHAHIAYIPTGRVVGLSKIPRLVDVFAHRLQVQERLTEQIAEAIDHALDPAGVGVTITASHMCMMMRGVEKQLSSTYTSAFRGLLQSDPIRRSEFLNLI